MSALTNDPPNDLQHDNHHLNSVIYAYKSDNSQPPTHELHDGDTSNSNTIKSKKREVYRYSTDWLVASVAWSNDPGHSFQLALSSYIEDYSNWVQLICLTQDRYDEQIRNTCTFEHPYPATKVLWVPRPQDSYRNLPSLIATTADYLRLWRVESGPGGNSAGPSTPGTQVKLEKLLNPNQGMRNCAPLTSFDWNEIDPSIIVTSSVDTTCAVWDLEMGKLVDQTTPSASPKRYDNITANLRSQIVAHNHEVYDVSFSRAASGRDVFISTGGDGSVRMFDLRRLSTSTMLYDMNSQSSSQADKALVRVACNKQDEHLVAAFASNSNNILLLDVRRPGRPLNVLSTHTANLNSISWAPHSAHHICSASDDQQALIWELSKLPNTVDEPLLAYRANGRINVISWSKTHSDWIAIGFENQLELLRV